MAITRRWSYCTMVMLDWFLQELWSFIQNSFVHNSTYSSKAIVMKLYRITNYHLKMIILCRGHAPLIITKVNALIRNSFDRFSVHAKKILYPQHLP